ncbi:MAG TPA: hypothetical protein PLA94_02935 [Myxococcota bacterium]|nr:hypothetical protein [Myxococcota bacterium]
MVEVHLLGSPGRRPFAGHFRGRMTVGGVSLAWAGRLAFSLSPPEAWIAADAARAALAAWPGGDNRVDAIQQAWLCLHRMEARWIERQDISVLFAAEDAEGFALSACGLQMIHERVEGSFRPMLSQDHPLLSEAGLSDSPSLFLPTSPGPWVGQAVGSALPTGDADRLCGIRSSL